MNRFCIVWLVIIFGSVSSVFAANFSNLSPNPPRALSEIRYPSEDWVAAQHLAEQADWAGWLKENRRVLDKWILAEREKPNQSVGWMHDYVNPVSGRFIRWTPESLPPPSNDGAKQYAAWLAYVRAFNITQIRDAARLYRLTGDTRYSKWARSQLDAYAANYANLKIQTWNGEARLLAQALDEAVYAFPLIEAVRLLRAHTSKEEIQRWRSGLFVPMIESLRRSCTNGSNITVWQVAAISAIAAEFNLEESQVFSMQSEYGLPQLLLNGVSKDQFWFEMSLQYQDYVVQALASWMYAISIRKAWGSGISEVQYQSIERAARGLMMAPLEVRFANMEQPMINDGTHQGRVPNRDLWGEVWRVLPTNVGIVQATLVKNWDTLLDTPPTIEVSALPKVVSQRVDGLYAVQLIDYGWQALMRYGQRSAGHAQQESLTYDLQFNGVWIFQDVGTVGYGSPLHKEFFRRAQAQNVPVIDRDGQLPWPSVGRLVNFDKKAASTKAEHKSYRPGVDVARSLWLSKTSFADRVEFNLTQRPAPVGLIFNTPCSVEKDSGLSASIGDTLGNEGGFLYWTQRRQFQANSRIKLKLSCAGASFDMTIVGKDIRRLFLATTPDVQPDSKREGIFVETDPVLKSTIDILIEPK